ncbi:hypothetical protein LguiB_007489 [Lonicera macranthoides]
MQTSSVIVGPKPLLAPIQVNSLLSVNDPSSSFRNSSDSVSIRSRWAQSKTITLRSHRHRRGRAHLTPIKVLDLLVLVTLLIVKSIDRTGTG